MEIPNVVSLANSALLVDDREASYVKYAVEELKTYLDEIGHRTAPIIRSLECKEIDLHEPLILIGRTILNELAVEDPNAPKISDTNPGGEGFILKMSTWELKGKNVLLVGGSSSQGTKYGVIELIKTIEVMNGTACVDSCLDRKERPCFNRRGMYVHLHWPYNYPYACRSWSVEDWKRYIDILAYFGVNLVQIWSMVGILPSPLSREGEAYLCKYPQIIEYAHKKRGIDVFIGEAANNVAESDDGTPIKQRHYFNVEVLKDPGDPKQFEAIMKSRKNLYKIADNADGYWIIDNDPAGWRGSPAKEMVNIFVGNRNLIEKYHKHPRKSKMVYWMWGGGWGTKTPEQNWKDVIKGFEEKLPEQWLLLVCTEKHLKLSEKLDHLQRSIFFPYGITEWEPRPPWTMLHHERIGKVLSWALKYPRLMGVMGNTQTPLVQLPNIFFFTSYAWNADEVDTPIHESLVKLAKLIFPDQREILALGWNLLASNDEEPKCMLETATKLVQLVKNDELGRNGCVGRLILPNPKIIVEDLVLMLRVRGYGKMLENKVDEDSLEDLERCICDYFENVFLWIERTGYRQVYKATQKGTYIYGSYADGVAEAWKKLIFRFGKEKADRTAENIRRSFKSQKKYDAKTIDDTLDPIINNSLPRGRHTLLSRYPSTFRE